MRRSCDGYAQLRLELDEFHVLVARIDRPQSANALNTATIQELCDLFGRLARGDLAPRCVVLTGAGDRAFCAGGDLKERHGMNDDDWRRQHRDMEDAMLRLLDCPVPVIAAVNGAAYGGGCEIALAADFAYAAASARFALTETSLGIIPGAGGTQTLARRCGRARANELIFSAQPFSAEEALAWGVVNRVLPDDRLMSAVLDVARRIAANGPLAVRQAKAAMALGSEADLRTGMAVALVAYDRLVETQDRREGVAAFNEKRPPAFSGT